MIRFKEVVFDPLRSIYVQSSKLGKVLKKMAALTEEIPREAEFKIKERANALMEQWKGMLNKEPTSAPAASGEAAPAASAEETNAGDLTVMQEDEKKEPETTEEKKDEEKPAAADATEEGDKAVASTNGVNGGVNAEGQTNGATEESKPAEEVKKDEPVAPADEKKEEAPVASEEVKENGAEATSAAA